MATIILISLGLLVIGSGILLFFRKKKFYKYGIRAKAKVVGIETYTYLTQGVEHNNMYYTGITPIIEFEHKEKKIRVAYYSIDDYSNLSEGDEVEVIFYEGKEEELSICNERAIYKGPLIVSLIGVIFIALSLIL